MTQLRFQREAFHFGMSLSLHTVHCANQPVIHPEKVICLNLVTFELPSSLEEDMRAQNLTKSSQHFEGATEALVR